jgi:DNA-binding MarR family transcriptional regulator
MAQRKDIGMGSYDHNSAKRWAAGAPELTLLQLARQTQKARINCSKHFPKNVFRDSAWDIMLELFIVAEEQRTMCVKEAVAVSGETPTSSLRRIEGLEEAGLVIRSYDPIDHRRVLVTLSAKGRTAMISFLKHLFDASGGALGNEKAAKPVSFFPVARERTRNADD